MAKFERIYWKKNFNWDDYAKLYDKYNKIKDNYYIKSSLELVNSVKLNDKMKVIDLACGTGALTNILLEKYPKINILAVDLSDEMLKYYKANFKKEVDRDQINFMQGNAEQINKLTSEKYDVVFISSALWDIDINLLLANLSKILNKNGKIVFNLPALVIGREKGFIFFIEHFFRQTLGSDILYRRISLDELKSLFNKNKFKIDMMKDYSFNLSKTNVDRFVDVLRYRYPFILFPESMPYSQKLKRCTEIFNDSLRYLPKEGINEEGVVFVIEKI